MQLIFVAEEIEESNPGQDESEFKYWKDMDDYKTLTNEYGISQEVALACLIHFELENQGAASIEKKDDWCSEHEDDEALLRTLLESNPRQGEETAVETMTSPLEPNEAASLVPKRIRLNMTELESESEPENLSPLEKTLRGAWKSFQENNNDIKAEDFINFLDLAAYIEVKKISALKIKYIHNRFF